NWPRSSQCRPQCGAAGVGGCRVRSLADADPPGGASGGGAGRAGRDGPRLQCGADRVPRDLVWEIAPLPTSPPPPPPPPPAQPPTLPPPPAEHTERSLLFCFGFTSFSRRPETEPTGRAAISTSPFISSRVLRAGSASRAGDAAPHDGAWRDGRARGGARLRSPGRSLRGASPRSRPRARARKLRRQLSGASRPAPRPSLLATPLPPARAAARGDAWGHSVGDPARRAREAAEDAGGSHEVARSPMEDAWEAEAAEAAAAEAAAAQAVAADAPTTTPSPRTLQRQRACEALMEGDAPDAAADAPLRCAIAWDGVNCWPETPAGALAVQPCFDELNGIRYDIRQNATRMCYSNGTWRNYSDYVHCRELVEAEADEDAAMAFVFFVGFCLSLVAIAVAIWIFLYFKDLRCLRNTIHTNLMATYICNDATWIISAVVQ
ncbi:Diuretic hormone receptor, partial [Gryllus bimaculatus]